MLDKRIFKESLLDENVLKEAAGAPSDPHLVVGNLRFKIKQVVE